MLWEVMRGELRHTLSNSGSDVISVAFGPDGTILISGNADGTIAVWDVQTGERKLLFTRLPGTEWIAYQPGRLLYASSLRGDEYGAVRFDHQLRPVYPLKYYRKELHHTGNLFEMFSLPQPVISPKSIDLLGDD